MTEVIENTTQMTAAQQIYHLIPQLTSAEMGALANEMYWAQERLKTKAANAIKSLGTIDSIKIEG